MASAARQQIIGGGTARVAQGSRPNGPWHYNVLIKW